MTTLSAPLTKDQALAKYKDALGLKSSTPTFNWLEVFPDASHLREFWAVIKDLSWPENAGSSPLCSTLTTLAFRAIEGLSLHSILFLQNELKSPYSGRVEDAKREIFLMRQYGIIGQDTEAQIWNPEPFERSDLFDFREFAKDHQ